MNTKTFNDIHPASEPEKRHPLHDLAMEIAQSAGAIHRPSYYATPFQPHYWVIFAIISGILRGRATGFGPYHEACDVPGYGHETDEETSIIGHAFSQFRLRAPSLGTNVRGLIVAALREQKALSERHSRMTMRWDETPGEAAIIDGIIRRSGVPRLGTKLREMMVEAVRAGAAVETASAKSEAEDETDLIDDTIAADPFPAMGVPGSFAVPERAETTAQQIDAVIESTVRMMEPVAGITHHPARRALEHHLIGLLNYRLELAKTPRVWVGFDPGSGDSSAAFEIRQASQEALRSGMSGLHIEGVAAKALRREEMSIGPEDFVEVPRPTPGRKDDRALHEHRINVERAAVIDRIQTAGRAAAGPATPPMAYNPNDPIERAGTTRQVGRNALTTEDHNAIMADAKAADRIEPGHLSGYEADGALDT